MCVPSGKRVIVCVVGARTQNTMVEKRLLLRGRTFASDLPKRAGHVMKKDAPRPLATEIPEQHNGKPAAVARCPPHPLSL